MGNYKLPWEPDIVLVHIISWTNIRFPSAGEGGKNPPRLFISQKFLELRWLWQVILIRNHLKHRGLWVNKLLFSFYCWLCGIRVCSFLIWQYCKKKLKLLCVGIQPGSSALMLCWWTLQEECKTMSRWWELSPRSALFNCVCTNWNGLLQSGWGLLLLSGV